MTRTLLALAVALASAGSAAAAGLVEDYSVNAQYRGAVKKGFQDIGSGKAAYEPLGGAAFRVKVKATVRHPKEDKEYAFNISQSYLVSGNAIRATATEKMELNATALPHERQITELLPFAYLARTLPVPADTGGERSRSFSFNGQTYVLRYSNTERDHEVSLYRGSEPLGKFFLQPERTGQFAQLEKFRILLPSDDLVVSFINTTAMAGR